MNINKPTRYLLITIKYILIIVPLLYLAKIGLLIALYKYNENPSINPNPTDKIRIYGKTSFGKDCKLFFNTTYIPNNSLGVINSERDKVPAIIKQDGTYEVTIYKDYFKQIFTTWKMVTFSPEFQCPDYIQGGVAMVHLTDKNKATKVLINCTKEQWHKSIEPAMIYNRVTCANSNSNSSIGEVSNSQKEIEIDFVDKGFNATSYELMR